MSDETYTWPGTKQVIPYNGPYRAEEHTPPEGDTWELEMPSGTVTLYRWDDGTCNASWFPEWGDPADHAEQVGDDPQEVANKLYAYLLERHKENAVDLGAVEPAHKCQYCAATEGFEYFPETDNYQCSCGATMAWRFT